MHDHDGQCSAVQVTPHASGGNHHTNSQSAGGRGLVGGASIQVGVASLKVGGDTQHTDLYASSFIFLAVSAVTPATLNSAGSVNPALEGLGGGRKAR